MFDPRPGAYRCWDVCRTRGGSHPPPVLGNPRGKWPRIPSRWKWSLFGPAPRHMSPFAGNPGFALPTGPERLWSDPLLRRPSWGLQAGRSSWCGDCFSSPRSISTASWCWSTAPGSMAASVHLGQGMASGSGEAPRSPPRAFSVPPRPRHTASSPVRRAHEGPTTRGAPRQPAARPGQPTGASVGAVTRRPPPGHRWAACGGLCGAGGPPTWPASPCGPKHRGRPPPSARRGLGRPPSYAQPALQRAAGSGGVGPAGYLAQPEGQLARLACRDPLLALGRDYASGGHTGRRKGVGRSLRGLT